MPTLPTAPGQSRAGGQGPRQGQPVTHHEPLPAPSFLHVPRAQALLSASHVKGEQTRSPREGPACPSPSTCICMGSFCSFWWDTRTPGLPTLQWASPSRCPVLGTGALLLFFHSLPLFPAIRFHPDPISPRWQRRPRWDRDADKEETGVHMPVSQERRRGAGWELTVET